MNQSKIDQLQRAWLDERVVGRCLNVGCGENPITTAVNIDPNPTRSAWRDYDYDVHSLPENWAGQFDSVVSNHVLPSLKDPVAALVEMARVMKPGAMMAHVVPDHRYAPRRRDRRFQFQYQHWCWYGPSDFMDVMDEVADVLQLLLLKEFTQFDWSFRVEAVKR